MVDVVERDGGEDVAICLYFARCDLRWGQDLSNFVCMGNAASPTDRILSCCGDVQSVWQSVAELQISWWTSVRWWWGEVGLSAEKVPVESSACLTRRSAGS